MKYEDISKMFDHALLDPTFTRDHIEAECVKAIEYNIATVCVQPNLVPFCHAILANTPVDVCTVIGFPLGYNTTATKKYETQIARMEGATEVDFVVNISEVLSGNWLAVGDEIRIINEQAKSQGLLSKIILETCYLNHDQIVNICHLAARHKVDFVKTSTGFGTEGANWDKTFTMLANSHYDDYECKVKVSGGVKTLDQTLEWRKVGVTRIGSSSTWSILEEAKNEL